MADSSINPWGVPHRTASKSPLTVGELTEAFHESTGGKLPQVDLKDIERRVVALEDRARREDLAKRRIEWLRWLGLKIP